MTDHGLTADIHVLSGGYNEDDGAAAARTLLQGPLPTAVIAANDLSAIGALDTVLRAGITVPGDLSIIGYDDSRFGRGSGGFPASTSPPSAKTSKGRPGQPSRPSSSDWINRPANRRTSR